MSGFVATKTLKELFAFISLLKLLLNHDRLLCAIVNEQVSICKKWHMGKLLGNTQ